MLKKNYYNIILYKKSLINLNHFINICNNMVLNKVVCFKYKVFPLLLLFIKKLLYLGLINSYKVKNKNLFIYFSYTKLGINSFTNFLFRSTYNNIKYVNNFFLDQIKLNYKINFNQIDLFLFENNFYTLKELNYLIKNKNRNNMKIIHICQVYL